MQIMAKSCLLAYERLQVVQKVVQEWPEGHFHMGWHFDSITNGAPCLSRLTCAVIGFGHGGRAVSSAAPAPEPQLNADLP